MRYTLYIILLFALILPDSIFGQIDRSQAKARYEELKAKGYIEPADTAFISVNDSLAKNLLLLDKEKTKYSTIEEAAMEVNRLLNTISSERVASRKINGGLAFKIEQRQLINKRKDKIAQDAWEEIMSKEETTVEDLVNLRARYGNRPTYYVNGYEVGQDVLNRIRESEVLTREYRIMNTASGNPNGEVWYEITSKAANRIKLEDVVNSTPIFLDEDSIPYNDDVNTKVEERENIEQRVIDDPIVDSSKDTKEEIDQKQEEIPSEKKAKRSVRKVKENIRK